MWSLLNVKIGLTQVNKNDLVTKVATASGLTKAEAERAVEATFSSITNSLRGAKKFVLSVLAPLQSPIVQQQTAVTPVLANH